MKLLLKRKASPKVLSNQLELAIGKKGYKVTLLIVIPHRVPMVPSAGLWGGGHFSNKTFG